MTARSKAVRKKIGNVAVIAVTVIALVLVAFLVFSRITGRSLIPYQVLWVLTPSMEDTIPAKSYILVKAVDAKDVEKEDIITFRSRDPSLQGSLNSHRVVDVIGDHERFVTKGDNNPVQDSYTVYAEDIVARYVCNLSVLTFFGRLYSTPAGLVATFAVLVIVMNIWIRATLRKLKKEETASKDDVMRERIAEEVERLKAANIELPPCRPAAHPGSGMQKEGPSVSGKPEREEENVSPEENEPAKEADGETADHAE